MITINQYIGGTDAFRRVAVHVEHMEHLLRESNLVDDDGRAQITLDIYADGSVETYNVSRRIKRRDGRVSGKVKIARGTSPLEIRETLWGVVSEAVGLLGEGLSEKQRMDLERTGRQFLSNHRARSPNWFRMLIIQLTFGGLARLLDCYLRLTKGK